MFGNRAVEVSALARSRLPPFHARRCGAKMDPRHVLDAAPLMAAMIDADIQSGFGIGLDPTTLTLVANSGFVVCSRADISP